MRYVDIQLLKCKEPRFIKKAMVVVSFETRTITSTEMSKHVDMLDYNKSESKLVGWADFKSTGRIQERTLIV